METKKNDNEARSMTSKEPRPLGSNLNNMFRGWYPHTYPCVDVKTLLRTDPTMKDGKGYLGVLRRDVISDEFRYEEHFTFHEERLTPVVCRRNPHLFNGRYISVTRRADGLPRLNFKQLKLGDGFRLEPYARAVYEEICLALGGLVED